MTAYNQNIYSRLTPPSLASSTSYFPVLESNSAMLEIELPWEPESLDIEYQRADGKVIAKPATAPVFTRDPDTGKIFLLYFATDQETCVPGDNHYAFTVKREIPQGTEIKTLQATLRIYRTFPDRVTNLIRMTRMTLQDDPTEQRRQIWSDIELYDLLNIVMMEINGTPTLTNFDLTNAPGVFGFLLVIGAEYHALRALYNNEIRNRFSFNDDGISIDLNTRAEGFMQMINHLYTTYSTQKQEIKRNWRPRAYAIESSFTTANFSNLRPYTVANLRGFNY